MDLIDHPCWICSGCLALCKWSVQQPHSRGFSGSRGCAALDTVERLHPSIILYSSIASRESWMPFCTTWRRISWSCCQDDKDMRAQRAARFSSHLERSSTNVRGPSIPVGQRLVEIGSIIDFVTVLFAAGIITESCSSKCDTVFYFGTCLLCCKMCLLFVSYVILVFHTIFCWT